MNKLVPLSEVFIDPSDNPRVDYSKLPELEKKVAEQGFDDSFPVQVVKFKGPTGEKYRVVGGFTRTMAAQKLKLEEIPVKITDYTPEQVLRNHLTSNSGNPLTQAEQGKVFVQLRDYGTDPEKLTKGEELREKPRTNVELAKYAGCSAEHVRNCITIAESPEEIRELLETGAVSANAVVDACKGVKEVKTIRKILEAAVKAADGKQATNKHVKDVKAQFVTLKGRTSRETNNASASAGASRDDKGGSDSGESVKSKTTAADPKNQTHQSVGNTSKSDGRAGSESGAIPDAGTTSSEPSLIDSPSPKRDQMIILITKWADDRTVAISDDDMEDLADRLIDIY